MSTRPPRLVWESRHGDDKLAELAELVRQYLAQGGDRMARTQVYEVENLTPLERALTPARH